MLKMLWAKLLGDSSFGRKLTRYKTTSKLPLHFDKFDPVTPWVVSEETTSLGQVLTINNYDATGEKGLP